MSNVDDPSSMEHLAEHAARESVTAGHLLRQAREDCGLHIAALAVSLKVPVRKLEALEANQLELLPDAVFARALASSICRTLNIDPVPVLARLPQTSSPKLMTNMGKGLNAPFHAPSDGPGRSMWAQISRPTVFAGLVLLLGALLLIFLPALKVGEFDIQSTLTPRMPARELVNSERNTTQEPLANTGIVNSSMSVRELVSTMVVPTGLDDSGQGISTSAAPTSPALASLTSIVAIGSARTLVVPEAPGSAPSASQAADIVVFSAKDQSWVEVTDSKGQIVLRRTLSAGEVVGASGALPLVAIVGRADATQVQVRGKTLDLRVFAKDNVARFEVK